MIPPIFTPATGKWGITCECSIRLRYPRVCAHGLGSLPGLFNIFVDDESYNSGHGHAYQAYGVDPKRGALVIVRPDHCESPICYQPLMQADCLPGDLLLTWVLRQIHPSLVASRTPRPSIRFSGVSCGEASAVPAASCLITPQQAADTMQPEGMGCDLRGTNMSVG